jgi:hypothetical protein
MRRARILLAIEGGSGEGFGWADGSRILFVVYIFSSCAVYSLLLHHEYYDVSSWMQSLVNSLVSFIGEKFYLIHQSKGCFLSRSSALERFSV